MKKYLFNDGTNVIKEVQSDEELKSLLQSCSDPSRTRVWVFDTNEWMSYSDFAKSVNFSVSPVVKMPPSVQNGMNGETTQLPAGKKGFRKFLLFVLAAAVIFSVYNFTKIKWEKKEPLSIVADWPVNSPKIDVDSLVQVIENIRGEKLDRITRTNFRIRNTWPDRITLKLTSDRFANKIMNKYENIELSIDNSTGYNLDNAVVQLNTWEKNKVVSADTFHFSNIGYVLPVKRKVNDSYRGDSLSVSFYSIKAKAFNFCYSSEKQSNYGNNNDRWFCRE